MTGEGDLGAFRSAVDDTMHDIEAEMKTRVRQNGKDEDRVSRHALPGPSSFIRRRGRWTGCPIRSCTTHGWVFNATFDPQEQRWKAGQFRDLKREPRTGKPPCGSGWPASCRISVSASTASAMISRSQAYRNRH